MRECRGPGGLARYPSGGTDTARPRARFACRVPVHVRIHGRAQGRSGRKAGSPRTGGGRGRMVRPLGARRAPERAAVFIRRRPQPALRLAGRGLDARDPRFVDARRHPARRRGTRRDRHFGGAQHLGRLPEGGPALRPDGRSPVAALHHRIRRRPRPFDISRPCPRSATACRSSRRMARPRSFVQPACAREEFAEHMRSVGRPFGRSKGVRRAGRRQYCSARRARRSRRHRTRRHARVPGRRRRAEEAA